LPSFTTRDEKNFAICKTETPEVNVPRNKQKQQILETATFVLNSS